MMEASSHINRPVGRKRARALALGALTLVAAVAVFILTDPLAGSGKPSDEVADNAAPTALASVAQRSLSSQMQVSGTLGYKGASSIRLPGGTPPSAVAQAQQSLVSAEERLRRARRTLSASRAVVAERRSMLAAAEGKQVVSGAKRALASTTMQLEGEREALAAAKRALAGARASLAAARASATLYGQGSTFTSLPAVGRVLRRGQSLYEIDGQPVLLLYGGTVPDAGVQLRHACGRRCGGAQRQPRSPRLRPGTRGRVSAPPRRRPSVRFSPRVESRPRASCRWDRSCSSPGRCA